MNVLDLFSGIGGFSLGLERAGMTTVAFCEIDPWCRRVLAKHWPDVPCFDDVRTLNAETLANAYRGNAECGQGQRPRIRNQKGGKRANDNSSGSGENAQPNGRGRNAPIPTIDLICGGYPCQPFSQAGKRGGAEDDRHLWPEMFRIIKDIGPAWVCCENVAGHISMGLDSVLSDLEGEFYTCQTFVVGAVAVDSPHRRQRIWVVANAAVAGGETRGGHGVGVGHGSWGDEDQLEGSRRQGHVADAQQPGLQGRTRGGEPGARRPPIQPAREGEGDHVKWQPEPGVGFLVDGLSAGLAGLTWPPEPEGVPRVAKGVPNRVSKLKALGNAVVPQIPEMIGRAIMAAHT